MATNGPVAIQGCAIRICQLNADGSPSSSSVAMIQDDRSFVKLEFKPEMEAGVEITPKSACGVPVISYKDCDRFKRWGLTLTMGDFDPEMLQVVGQGQLYTAAGSSGRTFNDGQTTINSNIITSPALADFLPTDVGRPITGTNIPSNAYISEYLQSSQVRMSAIATGTGTALSLTLGSQPVATIGYGFPHLLLVPCPFGISIEVWSKLIVRGTGYQGTTPYPSAGTAAIPGSAYLRTGIFRSFLWHDAFSVEDKEQTPMFTGWAIENPNFGTGPNDDWRSTAVPGSSGPPIDTTVPMGMLCDFQLPSPLQPGYQTPLV